MSERNGMIAREALGRMVREAWVNYCRETGVTKPSHLAPYDELSDWDQEADHRIGEAIQDAVRAAMSDAGYDRTGAMLREAVVDDETHIILSGPGLYERQYRFEINQGSGARYTKSAGSPEAAVAAALAAAREATDRNNRTVGDGREAAG